VRRTPYDVAILDLRMPGMDGLALYRDIRKLRSGTVALIVTAYATAETRQEALHAGAWQVLSKPVDFSQLLPLIQEAAEQPLVLLVDDDEDLCDNLWDLFRERRFRTCIAHNEREAEDRLRGRDFQVALIDMKLPQGDGQSVFRLVRRLVPGARTVLISGFRGEMEMQIDEIVKEGADAVCYKPFDVPSLLETVQRLSHHGR